MKMEGHADIQNRTGKNTGRGFADDTNHSHKETTNSVNQRGALILEVH